MRLNFNILTHYPLHLGAALALVFLFSCKKDKVPCADCPPTGETNCEDIQNVKKFFAFKVGSWWLYEEENSGERDSVYVTQYANDPSNYNFDVRMYSTHQDYFYHFWPEYAGANVCPESGVICKRCLSIKRSKYISGDFVGSGKCMFFIPEVGQFDYVYNSAFENNKVSVDQIYLNEIDLIPNNIRTIKIHELNTFIEGKQPTNHYFSENVGLIRKELLDSNQVWNLIDYYIQE